MKMTTKTLLILLGILVITFVAIQLTKSEGKSKSLKSELVIFDTLKVSKIEVKGTSGVVTLEKSNNDWQVLLEGNKTRPAKKSIVESLINSLATIKPGRLVAKKEEKWKDYAVDSTGLRVKIFEKDHIATDIVLGRFGVEGQSSFYTFVRLFEDKNVYVANDFMKMSVHESANDYRDHTIIQLKQDSLMQIDFTYPDSSFSLVKNGKWMLNDQLADSVAVKSYLEELNYLKSKEFYDLDFASDPTHTITFSFSNQDDIVIDGFISSGGFVVKSSENEVELFQDEKLIDTFLKGKNAFEPTSR